MPLPEPTMAFKQFLARAIVGTVAAYLLNKGQIGGENLMNHAMVGMVGAGSSIISESYVEPMMMSG